MWYTAVHKEVIVNVLNHVYGFVMKAKRELKHHFGITLHCPIYLYAVFSVTMDIWWKCFFYFISGEELAFNSHFSLIHP